MGNGSGEAGSFGRVPESVLLKIFTLLDAQALGRSAQVSRQWARVVGDPAIWKARLVADFNLSKHFPNTKALTLREREVGGGQGEGRRRGRNGVAELVAGGVPPAELPVPALREPDDQGAQG